MHLTPEQINKRYPVKRVVLYPNGVWRLQRQSLVNGPECIIGGKRNKIQELSQSSLYRLTFTILSTSSEFRSIQTLTYSGHYPQNGQTVKSDLNNYLTWMRNKFGKISYLWFLEFQKRGAPHFHILLSLPEPYEGRRKMAAREWAQIVSRETIDETIQGKVYRVHAHPKAWEAVREKDGAKRYALKYALKPHQKKVPKQYQDVGRFWGCSRDVRPKPLATWEATEDGVRHYLERIDHKLKDNEVLPRFLWNMLP